jgi:hypothetical protein
VHRAEVALVQRNKPRRLGAGGNDKHRVGIALVAPAQRRDTSQRPHGHERATNIESSITATKPSDGSDAKTVTSTGAGRRPERRRRRPGWDVFGPTLLIVEGRNIVEVARQAGHSPTVALNTYGHVFDELDGAEQRSAEDMIRKARRKVGRETRATSVRPRAEAVASSKNETARFARLS